MDFASETLNSIARGAGQWVAVGNSGGIYTTADDIGTVVSPSWSHHDVGLTTPLNSVDWQGTRFVAVGAEGALLTSADGLSWQAQNSTSNDALFASLMIGADLVIGGGPSTLISSSDDVSWRSLVHVITRAGLSDGEAFGGRVVAVGDSLVYSDDGTSWTEASVSTLTGIYAIDHFAGQWLIGGSVRTVATSADLVNWTPTALPLPTGRNSAVKGIEHNPGLVVAITGDGMASSPDAINWTLRATAQPQALTWGSGRFVAVGWDAAGSEYKSFTSDDGVSWTETVMPELGGGDVTWGGGQFVAVGSGGQIWTSDDGVTWLQRSSGGIDNFGAIGWDGSRFIAVPKNLGYVVTSPDGRSWRRQELVLSGLQGLAVWDGGAYLLGSDGQILTSVFTALCADPAAPDLTEGANGVVVHIDLNKAPQSTVTVVLTADAQVSVSPSTLHFDLGAWNQPQQVLVQALDDNLIEGEHSGVVRLSASSTDPNYDALVAKDLAFVVHDNDAAGIVITESAGSTDINEAGDSDSYQIVLSTAPIAGVDVLVNADSQVLASPNHVHFEPENWNQAQTITVTAVEDFFIEHDHVGQISHQLNSADPAYNELAVSGVVVHIADDDVANIVLTQSDDFTSVTEGGASDDLEISLTSAPQGDVLVTLRTQCLSGARFLVEGETETQLIFTAQDWDLSQRVVLSAIDDSLVNGSLVCILSVDSGSTDPDFDNIFTRQIEVTVIDNESIAGIHVVYAVPDTTPVLDESNYQGLQYYLHFDTQPAADVSVEISLDDQLTAEFIDEGTSTLTVSPNTFAQTFTILVARINDDLPEGAHRGRLELLTHSSDEDYDGLTWQLELDILDDDPGVVVTAADLRVSEGGSTAFYTLALSVAPTADVVVDLNTGAQILLSPVQVVFSADDFGSPQTVNISAIDDSQIEGEHSDTITHSVSSTDPVYNQASIPDLEVTISDNDPLATDAGEADDASVGLDSQTTADAMQDAATDADASRVSSASPLVSEDPGCGCNTSQRPTASMLWLAFGLLFFTRRRPAQRVPRSKWLAQSSRNKDLGGRDQLSFFAAVPHKKKLRVNFDQR